MSRLASLQSVGLIESVHAELQGRRQEKQLNNRAQASEAGLGQSVQSKRRGHHQQKRPNSKCASEYKPSQRWIRASACMLSCRGIINRSNPTPVRKASQRRIGSERAC